MEFRQIQYFLIVAQEKSFSRASKKAFVSQQALSKSILSLEKELGVSLFFRTPHGVELTDFGQILLKKSYTITNSIINVVSDFNALRDDKQHIITLAITAGIESWLDMTRLLAFHDLYPQYHVSTLVSNDRFIEKSMIAEKVDLGFLGSQGDTSRFNFYQIQQTSTLLAVHKDNPLCFDRDAVSIRDLKGEHLIMSSDDYYAGNRLRALCSMNGFSPNILHQSCSLNYIVQLVELNQGSFFLAASSQSAFMKPNIRLLEIIDDPKVFSLQLATKKGSTLSAGASLLYDYIIKEFS